MASTKLFLYLYLGLFSAPLECVLADSNGMDMSMDGAMSLASGNMLSYLHFTPGDVIWLQGWVPRSVGPIFGACIGLFLLALFDRWLAACRGLMELHWRKQAQIGIANMINTNQGRPPYDARASGSSTSIPNDKRGTTAIDSSQSGRGGASLPLALRVSTRFMCIYDVPRGLVQAAQSALEFAFMLVVMTYQVAFIIAIVIGLGVGETLFGRYGLHAHIY